MSTFKIRNLLSVPIFMVASSSFASRQEGLDCHINPAINLEVRTNDGEKIVDAVDQLTIEQLGNPHYANVFVGEDSLGIVSYSRSVGGRLISISAWQTVLNLQLKPQSGSEIISITEKQRAFTTYEGKVHGAPNSPSDKIVADVVCQFHVEYN